MLWTASCSIRLSNRRAGLSHVIASMVKKPRLNHEASRCLRSVASGASCGKSPRSLSNRARQSTKWRVPPGAAFSRRSNSCRRGSARCARFAACSALGWSSQALALALSAFSSGPRCSTSQRLYDLSVSGSSNASASVSCWAVCVPCASPRLSSNSRDKSCAQSR